MESIQTYRDFLKGDHWGEWPSLERDQARNVPPPPRQKPYESGSTLVDLIPGRDLKLDTLPLLEAINRRRSRRKFTDANLSLEELSFLLWSTQGAHDARGIHRTAPSAGARHPFETYLFLFRVDDVDPGLYRYLPFEDKLLFLRSDSGFAEALNEACFGQGFVGRAAAVFCWTAIPYRTEWRYSIIAHKMIAIDAGHVCQNLYLASEAIGAGTCGVGAYYHKTLDSLLGVDGKEEFAVYLAPVGKIAE